MITLPIDAPTIKPRLKQSFSLHTSLVLPGSLGHAPPESASLIVVTFLDLVPSPHVTLQDDQRDHSWTQGQGFFVQTSLLLPGRFWQAPPSYNCYISWSCSCSTCYTTGRPGRPFLNTGTWFYPTFSSISGILTCSPIPLWRIDFLLSCSSSRSTSNTTISPRTPLPRQNAVN